MASEHGYQKLMGSEHGRPDTHRVLKPSGGDEMATVTMILRRRAGSEKPSAKYGQPSKAVSRARFAAANGADPKELEDVIAFARSHGLEVVESHQARRSVVVRGDIDAIDKAFGVASHDYDSPEGKYRGHEGGASLPRPLADVVKAISGLDTRRVQARHFAKAPGHASAANGPPGANGPGANGPGANGLTPEIVARLYDFPPGDGRGQTIGIYEMQSYTGMPGYTAQDLALTMKGFGPALTAPTPIDVSVDGVGNTGVSNGETILDITIASAIAPAAKIAVYFTGGTAQSIIHALQRMIHPNPGDPEPTILSISYGWVPDDQNDAGFSDQDFTVIDQLFEDAVHLGITVLVSSGDTGARFKSATLAQTAYPAADPWVTTCGGTTIGNIRGTTFVEYVWNDTSGATGGGISARFPVPDYQSEARPPVHNGTNKPGRGLPDIAGNASADSGYLIVTGGSSSETVGGTSAVAPLFAGLIARINANLGFEVGFINPVLYSLGGGAFRAIISPPGPRDNSFQGVAGYPAAGEWNACTGKGSVKGVALQDGLKAAHAAAPRVG